MSGVGDGQFLYFAFGSNLLKQRLQLKNPTAAFFTTGRLKDYELKFGFWGAEASSWHGGVATIEHCPGTEVWGVIWILSKENLSSLDEQEAVAKGAYSPLEVCVETKQGSLICRTYQMNNFKASPPSPQYKEVLCLGAEQNGLPEEYLNRLKAIQTNGYSGPSLLDEVKLHLWTFLME